MTAERRLAAILSADVVGYSRLMTDHEQATIQSIVACRNLIGNLTRDHRGRVIDTPGDNVLAEFPNALDAVQCAVEIQRVLSVRGQGVPEGQRMLFRIGVHLGDITAEGESIYGDGVNIASRLERLAEPGGICISAEVQAQVQSKLELAFEDLGEQTVKNIARPVRVSRVLPDGPAASSHQRSGWRTALEVAALVVLGAISALAWQAWRERSPSPRALSSEAKSVAVLPFTNMSDDPGNVYFSDGIAEEVLNLLAQVPELRVIARTSSFQFRDRQIDLREVGELLDVSHLLEGSVRKSGNRVRVTAQLIRAHDNSHLWSGSYDHELNDIFAIQNEVSQAIVGALEPRLAAGQALAFATRSAISQAAYDKYLEARFHLNRATLPEVERAAQLFREVLELEPTYARAHTGLAMAAHMLLLLDLPPFDLHGTMSVVEDEIAEALLLGADDAETWTYVGLMHAYSNQDWAAAHGAFERALRLQPNDWFARAVYAARFLDVVGRHEEAIQQLERAERGDPFSVRIKWMFGRVLGKRGRYDAAIAKLREILELEPEQGSAALLLLIDLINSGDLEAASDWDRERFEGVENAVLFVERLRLQNLLAGLPPYSQQDVSRIRAHARAHELLPYRWSIIHLYAGDQEAALDVLEAAVEAGDPDVLQSLRREELRPLYSHPRYQAILVAAGLDDESVRRLGLDS